MSLKFVGLFFLNESGKTIPGATSKSLSSMAASHAPFCTSPNCKIVNTQPKRTRNNIGNATHLSYLVTNLWQCIPPSVIVKQSVAGSLYLATGSTFLPYRRTLYMVCDGNKRQIFSRSFINKNICSLNLLRCLNCLCICVL